MDNIKRTIINHNRPIKQGDSMGGAIGWSGIIDGEKVSVTTEIISHEYKKSMDNTIRRKILKKAKKLIIKDVGDGYEKLPSGEKERIQDKYITIVTTQKGWTSREFYNTDGKEINKLINKHL